MVKHFLSRLSVKYLIFVVLLLLNACTHVSRPDGPPNFHVDASKVPDAVPKAEKQSKYGNYATYHVFGKPYHVMKSSKNYVAVGTASWYGTKFHSRATSNGERYNMLSMTAAHKTLPLPTYAEVTNLRNNKTIIVKINDRGPFVGDRLIDLSYVAAMKLGVIGHGTARVRVRAIDPIAWNRAKAVHVQPGTQFATAQKTTPVTPPRYAASSKKGVYLQVGAFRHKTNAESLRRRLTPVVALNLKVTTSLQKANKLYLVEIGPFKDKATAKQMGKRLKVRGFAENKMSTRSFG